MEEKQDKQKTTIISHHGGASTPFRLSTAELRAPEKRGRSVRVEICDCANSSTTTLPVHQVYECRPRTKASLHTSPTILHHAWLGPQCLSGTWQATRDSRPNQAPRANPEAQVARPRSSAQPWPLCFCCRCCIISLSASPLPRRHLALHHSPTAAGRSFISQRAPVLYPVA